MSGVGWITSAYVTSLTGLYLTYGLLCGIGTGIVYIGIIGLMVRWFPDRRGFATGMVAAGYGFGAILTTFPIDYDDEERGLSAHAGGVRHHPRRRRRSRRRWRCECRERTKASTGRRHDVGEGQSRRKRCCARMCSG